MADLKESTPHKIVQYMLQNDPFSLWMGVELLEVWEGYCKISCPVKKEMMNGFDVTHGGILFSLADSALAFSSATYGRVALAIDNNISFLKQTVTGDTITAESECISLSHKTGVFQVRITNDKNELAALMKGTVYRTSREFELDLNKP